MVNFAPRVKVPVLMLNGRFDNFFPTTTSQEPLFTLLGTPAEHKSRVVYETAHSIPRNAMIKEVVGWLEKYLGATSAVVRAVRAGLLIRNVVRKNRHHSGNGSGGLDGERDVCRNLRP